MQGLYIHIPFCSQACHYCDFHFSTNLAIKKEMVKMICREIELRTEYLKIKEIDTIYFGGGTPSLLAPHETGAILNTLYKNFQINPEAEITLEANPDDLNFQKLSELKEAGFNRLSIGIQSFNDVHLKYLHRIHNSQQAVKCLSDAQQIGFQNISIDLIYGIPSSNHDIWKADLQKAFELNVQHISSYCLTIEPNTVFGKWVKTNRMQKADDDFSALQFEMLMKYMEEAGFEHYEISNFSLPGFHSRHNSNYWLGGHYLGLGPSAHSFDGTSRQYNIASNAAYVRSIGENRIPEEKELLSEKDRINEYLMTGLRTKWGCNFLKMGSELGADLSYYEKIIEQYRKAGYIRYANGVATLTQSGKLIADKITADFFLI